MSSALPAGHVTTREPEEIVEVRDAASGLDAVVVIDDTTLGPAAGGIRTRAYDSREAAVADTRRLARAMTIKCALAGLATGGGKCVVIEHPGLERAAAFARLGRAVEALGGRFRTAGDFGTTETDLAAMAAHTRWVHTGGEALAASVARGWLRCAEACAEAAGWSGLDSRRVTVQGAGAIGAAVARAAVEAGARVAIADVDDSRARAVADAMGATVLPPEAALLEDADLLAPCAIGGVITPAVASLLKARALCGAANNVLSGPEAAETLRERGILVVPDVLASAGAVIDGIGRTVMGLADRTPRIDALGATARAVLEEARRTGRTTDAVAWEMAERRIAGSRR